MDIKFGIQALIWHESSYPYTFLVFDIAYHAYLTLCATASTSFSTTHFATLPQPNMYSSRTTTSTLAMVRSIPRKLQPVSHKTNSRQPSPQISLSPSTSSAQIGRAHQPALTSSTTIFRQTPLVPQLAPSSKSSSTTTPPSTLFHQD